MEKKIIEKYKDLHDACVRCKKEHIQGSPLANTGIQGEYSRMDGSTDKDYADGGFIETFCL